jgi:hypothetical protein
VALGAASRNQAQLAAAGPSRGPRAAASGPGDTRYIVIRVIWSRIGRALGFALAPATFGAYDRTLACNGQRKRGTASAPAFVIGDPSQRTHGINRTRKSGP